MKAAVLVILSITFSAVSLLANPPAILAPQAAEIAQADLESRGLQNQVFIEQILFKKDGLMNKEAHWEVLWSATFPAQTEGRNEFGLRISMDGSYKRAVK